MLQFRLQDIVDLRDNTTRGSELLAGCPACPAWSPNRWREWYLAMPATLSGIAVGRPVWVNIDSTQLCDPEITASIERVFAASPSCVMEWTERDCSSAQYIRALDVLRSWSRDGIEIAIDDVGTGRDGIERVAALRPHYAKISAWMTTHARENSEPLRHMTNLLRSLGAAVVVEGIENDQDWENALDCEADFGQGYGIGTMVCSCGSYGSAFSLLEGLVPVEAECRSTVIERAA